MFTIAQYWVILDLVSSGWEKRVPDRLGFEATLPTQAVDTSVKSYKYGKRG